MSTYLATDKLSYEYVYKPYVCVLPEVPSKVLSYSQCNYHQPVLPNTIHELATSS